MIISGLPLTRFDVSVIGRALGFANEEAATEEGDWEWRYFKDLIVPGPNVDGPARRSPEKLWRDFRRKLNLVYEGANGLGEEIARRLSRVHTHLSPEGVQVALRSGEQCCVYALWLLIRGDGQLGRRLIRCEKCGKFDFNFVQERGRLRRDYCSDAHGKQLRVWKATHPTQARKRRRPEGPWERPWPA